MLNILQKEIAVFKNTQSSHKCDGVRSVESVLNAIRKNPKEDIIRKARRSGKGNTSKKYKIYSYGKTIEVNFYDYIKITKIPAVTWALSLKKGEIKRKSEVADNHMSGFIYYDIDSYDNCTLDEIKLALRSAISVVAVWKSFGGNGLGFLIYVENLTKDNFVPTWEHYKKEIEKFSIAYIQAGRAEEALPVYLSFDAVTKDYTRLNIVSHDPEIYISDFSKFAPLTAVNPIKQKNRRNLKNIHLDSNDYKIDDEVTQCHLEYVLNKWYNNGESYNSKEQRLNYFFYQRYFSECNILGIDFEDAFNFLLNASENKKYDYLFSHRSDGEVQRIGEKQYLTYNGQFNSWIDNYEGHPDYVIENFNVKYEGTPNEINELLNHYFYKYKRSHSEINETFIKRFSAIVKERGILRRHLIEFLIAKKIKTQLITLGIETYNIPYIPFGLVLSQSEEGKKKQRIDRIIKEEGYGKKTIEIKNERKIDNIFLTSIRKTENIYLFADFFFKKCNSYNISKENAIKSFIEDFDNKGKEVLAKVVCEEVYFNESAFKGLLFEKKINGEETIHFNEEYLLNENQYISDLNLSFDRNTIIWSDTNSGKTTFICSNSNPENKKIVLVPFIPLLKSIENKHKVSVFYGLKKNVNRNSDIIICTFKSFPRLFGQLSEWNILGRYELHLDEAHKFVTSASKSYMNEEMNFIIDKFDYFKKVLLYTGTWINFLHPKIKNFKTIRVKKIRKKNFKRISYFDKLPCVEQLCDKEKLNVIYLQSKKEEGELGKYKKFFIEKGWDETQMLFLNSEQKDNPEFEYVINEEKIKDKYNLIFCTSISGEGLNIYGSSVFSLHFCTNESPHQMEQVVNRFRDYIPENIYIYKKKEDNNIIPYNDLNTIQYQERKIAATEKISGLVNHKDNVEFFKTLQNTDFMRFNNGQYAIDYLSIGYSAYEHEKAYANNNIDYMRGILKQYGWEFKGDVVLEDKIEKDMLKTLKTYRKAKGLQLDIKRREIFNEIKKNEDKETVELKTSEEAMLQFQKNSPLPDYEISIRKRLLYFSRYMSWESALDVTEYWVKDLKCSNTKLNTLIKQLLIIKQHKTGYFDNSIDIKDVFFERLKTKYLDDKRLENEPAYLEGQLVHFVNKLGDGCEGYSKVETFEQARSIIERYLGLTAVIDKKGNIRYKFGAIKLVNEAAEHHKRCKAFATYHHKADVEFTKKDVKDYLLKIRKNLLYCAYYDNINEMNEKHALEILKIYCDVEHKGKGKYKVDAIEPFIFQDIEWNINSLKIKKQEEQKILSFAN